MARSHLQEAVSSNFIDGIERRSSPRADIVVRVNYQTVDSLFSEFARNINDGGLFVETDTPQPIGTSVELEFKLPGADRPIEVIGNVVRSIESDQATPDGVAGMGIEFENLDSDVREQINEIIQRLRSTGGIEPDASA
ncbi:MAG: TIGR02266 family protein [Deltaproteobacteria bacterium]|nr:TIGR02266 family protein [Deltaproteobacteria bacterium]MBW2692281.1 TIGR02266 family protein [Deltaproteobacteria bacterium]